MQEIGGLVICLIALVLVTRCEGTVDLRRKGTRVGGCRMDLLCFFLDDSMEANDKQSSTQTFAGEKHMINNHTQTFAGDKRVIKMIISDCAPSRPLLAPSQPPFVSNIFDVLCIRSQKPSSSMMLRSPPASVISRACSNPGCILRSPSPTIDGG